MPANPAALPEQSVDTSIPLETIEDSSSSSSAPPTNEAEIIEFPESSSVIERDWNNLTSYINGWYHDIDSDVLRIAMSAASGHKLKNEVPTWLFVLGASATGKSIIPEIVSPMQIYRLNSITANTLLSGLARTKGGTSLLLEIGTKDDRSGILVFPDFSTVISMREDALKKIAGDLREVYDGHLRKDSGAGKPLQWKGKVTILAMCTPDLERYWGPMRGLGERFVQVRWSRGDGIKQATKAYTQIGNEQRIKAEIRDLSKRFLSHQGLVSSPPLDPVEHGVAHISEITALLRTGSARDYRTKRLEDMSETEGNTRFLKAIIQIARAHAMLFKRDMVVDDYKLAARVAIDSIPLTRLQVVRAIPLEGISQKGLIAACANKPKTTIMRSLEELEYLGVVDINRDNGKENYLELSDKFRILKERAGVLWH